MNLSDGVNLIPKIQKPQLAALKKLKVNTVQDLLLYFPYRYLDFSQTRLIKDLKPGENVSLKVKIKQITSRFSFRGRMSLAEAIVSDDTGSLKVVWFNQPYLAKSLKTNDEIFLAGAADYYNFGLQMTNPIYEKASDPPAMPDGKAGWRAGFPIHTARLVPLYHLTKTIYPKTFRNFVAQVLPLAEEVVDVLPRELLKNQSLMDISQTIYASHFPKTSDKVSLAKKRLAFEEIFLNQLLAQKHKLEIAQKQAFVIKFDQNLVKQFVDSLPFQLTAEQKKAAWDVLRDLEKPVPMNRLLEGDVGSGKTLVALIAALQTLSDGFQAAFLAPTEILAQQHLATAGKFLKNKELKICLLTNTYSKVNENDIPKSKLQKLISEGMPGLFIGTHALLQKSVKFKNLALVIIDEQHRFGVEQRAELIKSGPKTAHLLSLSATPIPRTLQLAFYGELDISQIKSKPLGRKDILTKLVDVSNRPKAYEFIDKQILNGRQAFVITPLIEESETLAVKSAKKELENLQKIFPQFKIGLLHGKMKAKEKESVMNDFLQNKIQILVSTSVVEVGVDAPNASVMVIEGAERFGLAQLHQFRGRVGRAEHQSYCFLFTSVSAGESISLPSPIHGEGSGERLSDIQNNAITRLEAFTKTQDGFELAEMDLKQRGFGEVYGSTQTGWNFKYFDPSYTALIQPARREAANLLQNDPALDNHPLLKNQIKDKTVHFE